MWEGPLRPDRSPHKGGSHFDASHSESATEDRLASYELIRIGIRT